MIVYLKINNKYLSHTGRYHQIEKLMLECADIVFYFKEGMTHYIRDRDNEGYQYTEEEQVLLKLGAEYL